MKLNKISTLILLLFLVNSLWFFKSKINSPAPDVTFTTITGEKIQLADLQGNPVIITFWATDCASCIKEIPDLIDLYNQFHSKGLEIIAVAMYYDLPNHVVEMTKAKQLPYDVALDIDAKHAKAFGEIQFIPTTFLISPNGHIVMQKTGLFKVENIKREIEQFLNG